MWCKCYGTVVLGKVLGATLVYWCNKARLRSIGISHIFRCNLSSGWRGWVRLLLHCLRSIAGNSSGPPEEFYEIVFMAFGYLIVRVWSGVLKTLLSSFSSSLILFCCLVQVNLFFLERYNSSYDRWVIFYKFTIFPW